MLAIALILALPSPIVRPLLDFDLLQLRRASGLWFVALDAIVDLEVVDGAQAETVETASGVGPDAIDRGEEAEGLEAVRCENSLCDKT